MSLVRKGISQVEMRTSLFLFFGLLILSVTFFVSADDTMTDKNIFQDSDQDGLSNDEEALYKTDPLDKDSDDDGYTDGVEVESGYDPLKPAPGDRVVSNTTVQASSTLGASDSLGEVDDANLTTAVSEEIAGLIQQGNSAEGETITLDAITESVQGVMDKSDQEIVLPEVDIDSINIKSVSKKLKGERRTEAEKEDIVEYLTVLAYILANNSPQSFKSEKDLGSVLTSAASGALGAVTTGNMKYLEELSSKSNKILSEIDTIEVPEAMLDVHVKAIKMVKYSSQLKDEVKLDNIDDPIGQISSLGKVQGFLSASVDFSSEIYAKLQTYKIDTIPLSLWSVCLVYATT